MNRKSSFSSFILHPSSLFIMGFFTRDLTVPAVSASPTIEWEEPDCMLCGGRQWLPLIEAQDGGPGGKGLWFVVVQCQECGLCFTNPRPSPAAMRQFSSGGIPYPSLMNPANASLPWTRWLRIGLGTVLACRSGTVRAVCLTSALPVARSTTTCAARDGM